MAERGSSSRNVGTSDRLPDIRPSAQKPPPLLAGALFLVLSAIGWSMNLADRAAYTGQPMGTDPGPFALPAICLTITTVAGLALALLGLLRTGDRESRRSAMERSARRDTLPVVFAASLLVMPVAMSSVGSVAALALFGAAWTGVLRIRTSGFDRGALLASALVGLGVAVAVEGLAVRLLAFPLP